MGYWRNSETLFNHALQIDRNNYMAYHHLDMAMANEGKTDKGFVHGRVPVKQTVALGGAGDRASRNQYRPNPIVGEAGRSPQNQQRMPGAL